MNRAQPKRKDLVYPELSYQILGILFEVFRQFGFGYQEKYYQRVVALELSRCHIPFKKEVPVIVKYKGEKIGKYFFDFLVDEKIVLELKKNNHFSLRHIDQVFAYLKAAYLKLGIIANFTKEGIKFKRIVNLD
jgi:GxxExxY protein